MPGAKEAEMQALPDPPLSWTTASQGGPGSLPEGGGRFGVYSIYPCGVPAPCPEGHFFPSRNNQLSPRRSSSSHPHNPPKPPRRAGIR